MGTHHLREAQKVSPGDDRASSGGPKRRMGKLIEAARGPAEIRECMGSWGRLNILRQTDLSLPCGSPGLECWGRLRDLIMIPHFPLAEIAVLRWSPVSRGGWTLRMYLAHPVQGC